MRVRRHIPPWEDFRINRRLVMWLAVGAGAILAGYLTAFLILFPAPILPGHQAVPRVLGLTLAEAQAEIQKAQLQTTDGGAEPHPTATQGVVIWQDPPPGVIAPEGTKVTLVSSAGPPKIPVPDVAGLDAGLAQSLVAAAGLTVSQVESVQAASPTGLAMMTRPPAGTALAPGAGLTVVVSRGAPTIPIPDLLGMGSGDARTRLEMEGLQLGTVTRRRTSEASPGTVVGQRPAAGTLAAPGTVIDIVVARSPQ
ncbi:MAG TPA: PASTA domain-containing protein [Gemmatimonadales bacterium]|jgi:serine/threonine-protein kinase|nr:PASTA domain-containing protein [Gemmatimonadales bacterium]